MEEFRALISRQYRVGSIEQTRNSTPDFTEV
ncbi:hypothetical protein [Scytonema sp. UIC 10036]|nr:hypothetical protein [Scytonema sp. UIC 10036]